MSPHSNNSNPPSLSRRSFSIDKSESKMNEVYKKERVDVDEEATEAAASALTALSIQPKKEEETEESAFEIPERFTKSGRKKAVPFPVKVSPSSSASSRQLMKVLSDPNFNDIITWTPSGKSFTILDSREFTADILPDHFKSAKFSSFTRKLHRWGFSRHYRGEEAGAFYHKDFQKDRLDLAETMTCKSDFPQPKSTAAIASSSASVKKSPQQQQRVPQRPLPETLLPLRASLPTMPVQIPLPPPGQVMTASHLDAAIEVEVARRIQERIQQAALSRLFMQQQLNTNAIPLALRLQLMEMQHKKLTSIGGPRVPLMRSHNSMASEAGLEQLPRSNVQGAKTA